jgi:hypothetical protein
MTLQILSAKFMRHLVSKYSYVFHQIVVDLAHPSLRPAGAVEELIASKLMTASIAAGDLSSHPNSLSNSYDGNSFASLSSGTSLSSLSSEDSTSSITMGDAPTTPTTTPTPPTSAPATPTSAPGTPTLPIKAPPVAAVVEEEKSSKRRSRHLHRHHRDRENHDYKGNLFFFPSPCYLDYLIYFRCSISSE